MSAADPSSSEDTTLRTWHVAFALTTLGAILVVLSNPTGSRTSAAIAAALIALPQGFFWLFCRPSQVGIREGRPRCWAFACLATVAFAFAGSLNPWAGLALFAITPQIFMLLPFAGGAVTVVVLNLGPTAVTLVRGPLPSDDIALSLGQAAFVVAFSLFFANRLITEVRRSSERQALIDELRDREAQIAALSAARGAEDERTRIAREMHDTLAQGFTSIITLGHAARGELDVDPSAARRHVELMTRTAQENLAESRRIIAALGPAPLADASLPEAIERVTSGFAEQTGVAVAVQVEGVARFAPAAVDVVALRVVQESLANVRKHAAASHVAVTVAYEPTALHLVVADDGRGFDARGGSAGFGLRAMQARVTEIGGTFDLVSAVGEGCRIEIRLPLGALP